MLLTIFLWLVVFVVTVNLGFLFNAWSGRLLRIDTNENDLVRISLAGFVLLTIIVSFISVFFPIGRNVFFIVAGSSSVLSVFFVKQWKQMLADFKKSYGVYFPALFFLLIACYAAKSDYLDNDTGLYHAQAIQWTEKYPVIPGLGNIHAVLAYNSNFFLPCAFFSFSFTGNSFHVLNSWLLLLFSLYCLKGIRLNSLADGKKGLFYLLFLFLGFIFCRGKVGLPFPDVPVSILTWCISLFVIENFSGTEGGSSKSSSVLFLIAALAVLLLTIKLSSLILFLAVLCLLAYQLIKFNKKQIWVYITLFSLIVFPWICRNYILSGYPVFPAHFLNWFNPEWKIPVENVIKQENLITTWTSSPGTLHDSVIQNYSEIPRINILKGFSSWYANLSSFSFIFLWITVFSFFISLAFLFFGNKRSTAESSLGWKSKPLVIVWLCSWIGIIFWLFTAPDFRFIFGFLVIALITAFCFLWQNLNFNPGFLLKPLFAMLVVYLFVWPLKIIWKEKPNSFSLLLVPEKRYPSIKTKKILINGVSFIIPESGIRCWNESVPCLPCQAIKVVQIDPTDIAKGFKATN